MTFTELLSAPETYVSLLSLTCLEIVLGIDNIVFITIVAGRLPPAQQPTARRLGIGLALVSRLGLLFALSWIMGLTRPWFALLGHAFSGRDLVMVVGGLFLVAKATHEIYDAVEYPVDPDRPSGAPAGAKALAGLLLQVMVLDMVFSLDSVITAVGMVDHFPVMVAAMIIAVAVMMAFAGPVGDFVQRHASVRVLALAFLVLIGVLLLAEGFGRHLPKGYVYFSMAFALGIEIIHMRRRARREALLGREVEP